MPSWLLPVAPAGAVPRAGADSIQTLLPGYEARSRSGTSLMHLPGCRESLAQTRAACDAYWKGNGCLNSTWSSFWSPGSRLAYLKTAKAGSVSMEAYMHEQFNDTIGPMSNQFVPPGVFSFTFVRDPLERALAGYAEVDAVHRSRFPALVQRHAHKEAGTTYVQVPHEVGNGTARFLAYLDDVVAVRRG